MWIDFYSCSVNNRTWKDIFPQGRLPICDSAVIHKSFYFCWHKLPLIEKRINSGVNSDALRCGPADVAARPGFVLADATGWLKKPWRCTDGETPGFKSKPMLRCRACQTLRRGPRGRSPPPFLHALICPQTSRSGLVLLKGKRKATLVNGPIPALIKLLTWFRTWRVKDPLVCGRVCLKKKRLESLKSRQRTAMSSQHNKLSYTWLRCIYGGFMGASNVNEPFRNSDDPFQLRSAVFSVYSHLSCTLWRVCWFKRRSALFQTPTKVSTSLCFSCKTQDFLCSRTQDIRILVPLHRLDGW